MVMLRKYSSSINIRLIVVEIDNCLLLTATLREDLLLVFYGEVSFPINIGS